MIVSVMTAASVQTAALTLRSGVAFRQSQLALYSAEAGLRLATANWPDVSGLNPGDSIDGGWQALPNHAIYRAVITRVDGGTGMKTYLMVVQGRGVGSHLSGGQRTIVRVVGNAPIYKWGIYTSGGITMSGNAGTDAYNSNNGTYAQTVDTLNGSVATNGSISASGNVKIKGACTTANTISSGNWCTNTVTQHATPLPTMAMFSCPSSFTPASEVSGVSYSASNGTLSGSGNSAVILSGATSYYFSSISLSGNSNLTVTSGTLTNAGSFVTGGQYTIITVGSTNWTAIGAASNTAGLAFTATGVGSGTGVAATGPAQHVDVYVSGSVSLSGNGVTNVSGAATMLGFSSCGSSTASWSMSGNGSGAYTVYAPNSALSISGNGDLYGAFIGKTFSNTGNGKLHFDTALENTGGTTLYVLAGSWTELTVY